MKLEIVKAEEMRPFWSKARLDALKLEKEKRERFRKGLRWIVR